MKKFLLFSILVIALTGLIFTLTYTIYTDKYETVSPETAKDTVVVFCSLLEKGDKKTMENYITSFPGVYWDQVYERAPKISNVPREIKSNVSRNNSNIFEEASPSKADELPQIKQSGAELLETVAPQHLFDQKRYLKKINKIWEKEDQSRIEVVLGSRTKDQGFGDISTNFWLYKEKDGRWRVFLIQSAIMNDRYAM
jgi:hypothetical protein